MGNIEVHDFAPVHDYERKELNLSKKMTYKQYCKHLNGEAHESMLTELPWSIRDSISLYERMNVSFNAITELPSVLPLRLPHLCHLDLSHNRLNILPESFGLLFHLKTIYISHNKLKSLPNSFVHLVKLEKIDLSYNVLKELPVDIGEMESLSKLNISHNKLKSLPLSLGGCPTLTLLLAVGNRLDTPPQAICNEGTAVTIEFLRKLYISSSPDNFLHRPVTPLNDFPRVRGNQLHRSVTNPQSAHVQYIQEQTHTTNTASRIKTPLLPPLGASSLDSFELRDRIVGMIYGAAIGDAIGIATRWMSKDECNFYYSHENIDYSEIVQDEHRVRWRKGDWAGNFDLFMLVFDSIISWGGVVDELDFVKKMFDWSKTGFPELGDSEGVVLSETIQQILTKQEFIKDPHGVAETLLQSLTKSPTMANGLVTSNGSCKGGCEENCKCQPAYKSILCSYSRTSISSCDHFGTDNGAVVRTAILGVPFFHNLEEVVGNSLRICRATHADCRCCASCVMISSLVALMLQGKTSLTCLDSVEKMIEEACELSIQHLQNKEQTEDFRSYVNVNTLKDLKADSNRQRSYTHKPMAAGILALKSVDGFKKFIMKVVHEAGDSNSNACVAGALLGCKLGFSYLPSDWIDGLRKKQTTWLNAKINILLDMMGIP